VLHLLNDQCSLHMLQMKWHIVAHLSCHTHCPALPDTRRSGDQEDKRTAAMLTLEVAAYHASELGQLVRLASNTGSKRLLDPIACTRSIAARMMTLNEAT
jgi:hypothetical protein